MKKTAFVIGLFTLCLAISNASAGPFMATATLEPTQAGFDLNAGGVARISRNLMERFALRASGKIDDGSVLVVSAITAEGKSFDVGAIRMFLGSGSIELNSSENGLSPAFPVQLIKTVTVSLHGQVILEGEFVLSDESGLMDHSAGGERTGMQGR